MYKHFPFLFIFLLFSHFHFRIFHQRENCINLINLKNDSFSCCFRCSQHKYVHTHTHLSKMSIVLRLAEARSALMAGSMGILEWWWWWGSLWGAVCVCEWQRGNKAESTTEWNHSVCEWIKRNSTQHTVQYSTAKHRSTRIRWIFTFCICMIRYVEKGNNNITKYCIN